VQEPSVPPAQKVVVAAQPAAAVPDPGFTIPVLAPATVEPPKKAAPPEPALLTPPAATEPAAEEFDTFLTTHRGDTPMLRTWKMLGLNALLAGALTAAAPAAEPAKTNDKPAEPDQTAAIMARLRDMETKLKQLDGLDAKLKPLADLKTTLDGLNDSLKQDFAAIKKDMGDLRGDGLNTNLKVVKAQEDLNDLRKQLESLRLEVEGLRKNGASRQTAAYAGATPAPGSTGRIRLMNSFFEPQSIWLNGKAYNLVPGQTFMVDAVPAGEFTYEIPLVRAKTTRTLAANEMFTINIVPQ